MQSCKVFLSKMNLFDKRSLLSGKRLKTPIKTGGAKANTASLWLLLDSILNYKGSAVTVNLESARIVNSCATLDRKATSV